MVGSLQLCTVQLPGLALFVQHLGIGVVLGPGRSGSIIELLFGAWPAIGEQKSSTGCKAAESELLKFSTICPV